MELYGGIYGLSGKEIAERVEHLLNRLNFADHKDDLVGSLPLGWKQKLAFMVAAIHRPEIIFLDEPTGGVDPMTRQQFWELIRLAAADWTTIFVTTHYMDEAEFCDRVTMMVDGQIRALDSPANLRKQYGAESMEQVFYKLAREAKRGE